MLEPLSKAEGLFLTEKLKSLLYILLLVYMKICKVTICKVTESWQMCTEVLPSTLRVRENVEVLFNLHTVVHESSTRHL